MTKAHAISFWSMASIAIIASLILAPFTFISAAEDAEREHKPRPHGIHVEIDSISVEDDGTGTIEASFLFVNERVQEEKGVQVGDSITVTFTSETSFYKDKEEVSAEDYAAGDIAFIAGKYDEASEEYTAKLVGNHPPKPRFIRHGEVVEVNTEDNTILVKPFHAQEGNDGEYVLVSYGDATEIKEDREEASESDITVGDKIRVRGEINLESDTYLAEIEAEFIALYDEMDPKPYRGHGPKPQIES